MQSSWKANQTGNSEIHFRVRGYVAGDFNGSYCYPSELYMHGKFSHNFCKSGLSSGALARALEL